MAYSIQTSLERDAEITVWDQGVFDLSKSYLSSLLEALARFDFAAFVFAPEDVLKIRDEEVRAPRDNIVFELGLFMGRLGTERTFFVMPRGVRNMRLPTDLLGIEPASYEADREDRNLQAALGPACQKIRNALQKASGQGEESASAVVGDAALRAKRVKELVKLEKVLRDFQSGFGPFKREVNRLGLQPAAERLEEARAFWEFLFNPRAELAQFKDEMPHRAVSKQEGEGALIEEQWLKELLEPAEHLEAQLLEPKMTEKLLAELQILTQRLHFELKRKATDLAIKLDGELRNLTDSTEQLQRYFEK